MKYFGTDGIRGKFGTFPINECCFNILAQALKYFHSELKRVVIGYDSRFSGKIIKDALIAGFSKTTEIVDAGVITSPLLSQLVLDTSSDFGLMITASHNPAEDNGVKVFDHFGTKLSQTDELKIESLMDTIPDVAKFSGHRIINDRVDVHYSADGEIFKNFPKAVIDCANGAAVEFAKKAYHFPKAEWLGITPNGYNINESCGSEHPNLLIESVCNVGANLGIAHDGDGDRLLLCDGKGNILPGEVILGIIAIYFQQTKCLKGHKVVTTLMANRGLAKALEKYSVTVDYSEVGDRNVVEKMNAIGCNFGGEPSGHIIFIDNAPTSDGIQTALLFLKAINYLRISIQKAMDIIPLFPKISCDIAVKNKIPLEELPDIQDAIRVLGHSLGTNGKVFVRYSGTEHKLRLLVEAEKEDLAETTMNELKNSIENCKNIL